METCENGKNNGTIAFRFRQVLLYIEKNCASRWSFTKSHYMMHGQQNLKDYYTL